jgi:hypothetical protein
MTTIPLCTHIKTDGFICQSPALRGKALCYHHGRPRSAPKATSSARSTSRRAPYLGEIYLPPLHDAESIAHAMSNICQAVVHCHIPLSRARLLLKAIDIARIELRL